MNEVSAGGALAATESLHPKVALFMPTFNAEPYLDRLLPAIRRQRLQPGRFLVIDSSSTDDSAKRLRDFGAEVRVIAQDEFSHGGTRRAAVDLLTDYDFLILLTQDAIPADLDAFANIIEAFSDVTVGLAYGRQLPRESARAIERHARCFNYAAAGEVRSLEDRKRLGIKATFCSNSFAAYRTSALVEAGSFPPDAAFAEDQLVAARMLLDGWKVAYVGEARVIHSHEYSIRQDYRRYFEVGVFHGSNPWLLKLFGRAEGEGLRFLRSELSYLAHHEPWSIPNALIRTVAKYAAYRRGRRACSSSIDL